MDNAIYLFIYKWLVYNFVKYNRWLYKVSWSPCFNVEWDPLENTSFTRTTKITRIVSGVNGMSFITFLFQQFKTVLHWTITEYTYNVSEYNIYLCLPQKLTDQKRNAWELVPRPHTHALFIMIDCVYTVYIC
jgi:hypothetical protein